MKLSEIGPATDSAFFCCLGDVEHENQRSTVYRRQWYTEYKDVGYWARVLVLDDGKIVGKCHTIPIDHSPFEGRDLLAILCVYVHMYARHIGDQRCKGYGRYMLEQIEKDAQKRGFKGVVAWAMDWNWNPVSFYEHAGYTRVDQEEKVVAVWKPFCEDAIPPRLLRLHHKIGADNMRVSVIVADNPWCLNYSKRTIARAAIQGIEHLVEYSEVDKPYDGRIIHLGHVGGVFLDGNVYRPYELIGDSDDLKAEIVRLYEQKKQSRISARNKQI